MRITQTEYNKVVEEQKKIPKGSAVVKNIDDFYKGIGLNPDSFDPDITKILNMSKDKLCEEKDIIKLNKYRHCLINFKGYLTFQISRREAFTKVDQEVRYQMDIFAEKEKPRIKMLINKTTSEKQTENKIMEENKLLFLKKCSIAASKALQSTWENMLPILDSYIDLIRNLTYLRTMEYRAELYNNNSE